MQGLIYQLSFASDGASKHPHVVVVPLGEKECLVVPGYSKEGFTVNQQISALRQLNYYDDEIYCELDNRTAVHFTTGMAGKDCYWFVARQHILSRKTFETLHPVGSMTDAALLQIAEQLLRIARRRPNLMAPKVVKALERLLQSATESP